MIDEAFAHLDQMSDRFGVHEHADLAVARPEHGYCTDDMARVLVVAARQRTPRTELVDRLEALALDFVVEAQGSRGDTRNRRQKTGSWEERHWTGDCWGRSVWGLGVAAARADDPARRATALAAFERSCGPRSPWRRSMAFAVLGAADVVSVLPDHREALGILHDAFTVVGRRQHGTSWEWPEPRLSYANAVLPEALIAIGQSLPSPPVVDRGLALLDWLVEHETRDGRLSVTPVGGSAPEDRAPRFDQQPIEVAAIADACARAFAVTGDRRWADRVQLAADWFSGSNDGACAMQDPSTGGGYDGLRADGPNLNQGAESTLALISTIQQADALVLVPR